MPDAQHDVKVLNSLIETTIDSLDGYQKAAKETKNDQFRRIFEERSFERQRVCEELRQEVRTMGGEPKDDGSMLADAHRGFLKLRGVVMGGDDKQVIDEVERGEDFIKNKYEMAMRDEELTMPARETVTRAYDSVKTGHDQMSALKHGLDGDRLH